MLSKSAGGFTVGANEDPLIDHLMYSFQEWYIPNVPFSAADSISSSGDSEGFPSGTGEARGVRYLWALQTRGGRESMDLGGF